MTKQSTPFNPFARAEHTACHWLDTVAQHLGTDDRRYTFRVLRAWLHIVRDRLTVDTVAHLGAQLPELLRGLYYEGWNPSPLPIRYDIEEFVARYAHEADISAEDVNTAAIAVTGAVRALFSPGQLDHALAQLPHPLRAYLTARDTRIPPPGADHADDADRLRHLEHQFDVLTQAVAELAHGLEPSPLDEPDDERVPKAARTARQLLLTRGGAR